METKFNFTPNVVALGIGFEEDKIHLIIPFLIIEIRKVYI